MYLYEKMQDTLEKNQKSSCFRFLTDSIQHERFIEVLNRRYINLSSNDYLGIGHDKSLVSAFIEKYKDTDDFLLSSSSSRLLTGSYNCCAEFENIIGSLYNREALYFNSGFDGNSGVLQAIADENTLILADKKSHASIIDGMRLSKARSMRFAHNDMNHLKSLVDRYHKEYRAIIIVTEALFSMDGDIAPLMQIVRLKSEYDNICIYVDEAHSFFVYGGGPGLCYELGIADKIDFILVTLGKAFGSSGAALICHAPVKSYLINTMRPFIFTTALPPLNVLYSVYILKNSCRFDARRKRLFYIKDTVLQALKEKGICAPSQSYIIPLILGDNDLAIKGSHKFLQAGLYALPVRYPTVPKGQARVRLSLSSSLLDKDIDKIIDLIGSL